MNFRRIPLITVAEGEISELHVGLKGIMSVLYLKRPGAEDPPRSRRPGAAGTSLVQPVLFLGPVWTVPVALSALFTWAIGGFGKGE